MNYTVKAGDNLGSIAQRYNTTVAAIKEKNPHLTAALPIGTQLQMPTISLFKAKEVGKTAPLSMPSSKPTAKPVATGLPAVAPIAPPDQAVEPKAAESYSEESIPTAATMPSFEDFVSDLEMIEDKFGLPSNLLAVLAFLESSGNPAAQGSGEAGAKGMFQATPIFLKDRKVKNPYDLVRIPRAVAAYLVHAKNVFAQSPNRDNFTGFGWDKEWELAMMAYHAGVQGVLRWLKAGAPQDGKHPNVGGKTLTYAEKAADLMLANTTAQIIEPAWRRFTKT